MKSFSKPIAFCAALLLTTTFAAADTFHLGSYCTTADCPTQPGLSNTATVFGGYSATELTAAGASAVPSAATPTFFADPGSYWTPVGPFASPYSNYVSWQPGTGPGNFSNSSAPGFYNYFSTFDLSFFGPDPSDIVGLIDVAADDTTDVWLNGILLTPEGDLGANTKCADGLPNCRVHLGLFLHKSDLQTHNVLAFSVQQTGDFTGLDYDASFNIVPEPNTLLLIATGLLASAKMISNRFSCQT